MRKPELFKAVLAYLGSTMDNTETELHYTNPFELLVAVVLNYWWPLSSLRNARTSASTW